MDSQAELIARCFEEIFRDWGIGIQAPPEGPVSGHVRQQGGSGSIRYIFAEGDRGPYLEYYSFHRIGGESHARIYPSGEVEHLDVLATTLLMTGDPDKDRRQREKQEADNRALLDELEAAGLLSGGPVPNSFLMNAALTTGVLDDKEDPSSDD